MTTATTRATVTMSLDENGNLVAEVQSDDDLTLRSVKLALEEFWQLDAKSFAGANVDKWVRRLRMR